MRARSSYLQGESEGNRRISPGATNPAWLPMRLSPYERRGTAGLGCGQRAVFVTERDGKIARVMHYFDFGGLLAQVSAMPGQ